MSEPTVLPSILQIAIKRRYLETDIAVRIAEEARRTRRPIERLLIERGVLSKRRLERLNLHVKYRSLRDADKGYARAALRAGLVTPADLDEGLAQQRALFEADREVVRLGAILVDRRLVTPNQDRSLREQLSSAPGQRASGVGGALQSGASAIGRDDESGSGSAATLLEASSSKTPLNGGASSYRQIDAALERVERIRAAQEELSTSEDASEKAGPDSAAEYENALTALARARFQPDAAKVKAKKASRPAIRLGA